MLNLCLWNLRPPLDSLIVLFLFKGQSGPQGRTINKQKCQLNGLSSRLLYSWFYNVLFCFVLFLYCNLENKYHTIPSRRVIWYLPSLKWWNWSFVVQWISDRSMDHKVRGSIPCQDISVIGKRVETFYISLLQDRDTILIKLYNKVT